MSWSSLLKLTNGINRLFFSLNKSIRVLFFKEISFPKKLYIFVGLSVKNYAFPVCKIGIMLQTVSDVLDMMPTKRVYVY